MTALLTEIFKPPFKFVGFLEFSEHSEGFKALYKTKRAFDGTNSEEVYIYSKMYLDYIVKCYENYILNGKPITETSFRLFVEIERENDIDTKNIYLIAYDNVKKTISWEEKYNENLIIEGNFRIKIEVIGHYFDNRNSDDDDDIEPYKKTISETECIVCFENKPNLLYSECLHICVCVSCDTKGKFTKCPLCRTKIKTKFSI